MLFQWRVLVHWPACAQCGERKPEQRKWQLLGHVQRGRLWRTWLTLVGQAGAAHVYAVEMSGIAEQARQIVADNGYSDRITLLQAKVEDITLPVDQARVLWPTDNKAHQHVSPMLGFAAAACKPSRTAWHGAEPVACASTSALSPSSLQTGGTPPLA